MLIGGQIGSGKTAVATSLAETCDALYIPVRAALQEILGGRDWDRPRLQKEGAELDRRTNGRWVLEYLSRFEDKRIVVDAARTRRQVEPILEAGIGSRLVYLAASEYTRRNRYALAQATDMVKRSTPFDRAMNHPTEIEATALRAMADIVIETDDFTVTEVVQELRVSLSW